MPLALSTLAPPPAAPQVFTFARATWLAPDGVLWPLTDTDLGYWATDGIIGVDAAPISLTVDPYPRGGARVRHIQPQPRLITLPLYAWGPDHMRFIDTWRALIKAFTLTRRLGPGVLRIERPDGTAREIRAYYQDGFTGVTGVGHRWDAAALTLFCEDPYWSDVAPLSIARSYAGTTVPFLHAFPSITDSRTLGRTTMTNPGDVEAWPLWAITGPAAALTATNHTTGESFTLTPSTVTGASLAAGAVVTIDTLTPSVRGPDGSVWTAALDWPGAVLWGLAEGDNDVEFAVTGSATQTSVALSFHPRYESS